MKKQAVNPYLPSFEYVADGEPHVFGNRLYIYGSHDTFGATAFCEKDYVCWSAPADDLSDWKCEGVIYRKNQDPMNKKGKMRMFAPDVWYLRLGIDLVSPVKGANGNQVVELENDMLTVKSVKQLIPGTKNSAGTGFEGHEFYEASSIRKFGEKYYFIYSSILSHELAYAVSDYPDRDFRFAGTLHSNAEMYEEKAHNYWGNNHGSIECVNGEEWE